MKVVTANSIHFVFIYYEEKSVEEILANFHIDQNVLPTVDIQNTVFLSRNNEIVMFG